MSKSCYLFSIHWRGSSSTQLNPIVGSTQNHRSVLKLEFLSTGHKMSISVLLWGLSGENWSGPHALDVNQWVSASTVTSHLQFPSLSALVTENFVFSCTYRAHLLLSTSWHVFPDCIWGSSLPSTTVLQHHLGCIQPVPPTEDFRCQALLPWLNEHVEKHLLWQLTKKYLP